MKKKLLTGFLASALGLASIVSGQQANQTDFSKLGAKPTSEMTKREAQAYVYGVEGNKVDSTANQANKKYEIITAELDITPVFNILFGLNDRASFDVKYEDNGSYVHSVLTDKKSSKKYILSAAALDTFGQGYLRKGIQTENYFFPVAVNVCTYDENANFTSLESVIPKIDFKGYINKKPFSLECVLKDRMPVESVGEYDGKKIKVTYTYKDGETFSRSSTVTIGDKSFLIERNWSQHSDGLMYIDDLVVSRK